MKNTLVSAMAIVVLSGGELAMGAQDPVRLEPSRAVINKAAHIYYNAVSGERIVTLLADGQSAPADTGASQPVWASLVGNTCEAFGYTTELFFAVDEGNGYTPASNGLTLLDYGDIYLDTVVDCIQVNWIVAYPDQDLDGDGAMDGVEELAGQWMVWDADNGRQENANTRMPILDILLFNLPGNTPENIGSGVLAEYTMDIDLIAFGTATDLSFELGDSDGDCQTAEFCNSSVLDQSDGTYKPIAQCDNDFNGLPDSDLDGDGLFDWSWTVRFYAPQMGNDFDSDSDTGTLPGSSSDTIGVGFAAPEGSAIDNGDGTFTWSIDTSVQGAGFGAEDRFALYNPPNSTGDITYNGGYWFGGFACTGGLISTGGTGYTPPAMFQFVLYGPSYFGCGGGRSCPSDFNCDGVINFFDVSAFLTDWQAGGDYNNDGQTDFFDVSAFLSDFYAGCP
jgi:hypothetical protein